MATEMEKLTMADCERTVVRNNEISPLIFQEHRREIGPRLEHLSTFYRGCVDKCSCAFEEPFFQIATSTPRSTHAPLFAVFRTGKSFPENVEVPVNSLKMARTRSFRVFCEFEKRFDRILLRELNLLLE